MSGGRAPIPALWIGLGGRKTLVPEEVRAELSLEGQVGAKQTIGRVKSSPGRGDSMGKGLVEIEGCLQRTSHGPLRSGSEEWLVLGESKAGQVA